MMPRLVTSGPDAVRAATQRAKQIKTAVPFPWDLPPENSKILWAQGKIVVPAVGAAASLTVVTSFQVPDGFQAVIRRRLNVLSSNAVLAQGSGDLLWSTDINIDPTVTTPQGLTVQGMYQESFTYGSLDHGTAAMAFNLLLQPNDIIRVKCVNAAFGSVGAPNYLISILEGWYWPVDKR